jgi:ribosomal protein L11 methylase PrmA
VDLVCSNILRLINEGLLPEIGQALRAGGTAIFSGMQVGEADLFRAALGAGGFTILDEVIDDHWWAVAAVKA